MSYYTVEFLSRAECYRESGSDPQNKYDLILVLTMANDRIEPRPVENWPRRSFLKIFHNIMPLILIRL